MGAPTIRQLDVEWIYGETEENAKHETMKFVLVMCCGQGQARGADDHSFWWADLPDDVIKTIAAMIGVEPKLQLRFIRIAGRAVTAEVALQELDGRPGKIIKAWGRPCMSLPQGIPLTSTRQERAKQDQEQQEEYYNPTVDVMLGEPFQARRGRIARRLANT